MSIFALGLAFDAGQTVRSASVTLRGHQLHDLCRHDKIGLLVGEYGENNAGGRIVKSFCAKSFKLDWTASCSICFLPARTS